MPVPAIVGVVIAVGSITGISLLVWGITHNSSKFTHIPVKKKGGARTADAPLSPLQVPPLQTYPSSHTLDGIFSNDGLYDADAHLRLISISHDGVESSTALEDGNQVGLTLEPIREEPLNSDLTLPSTLDIASLSPIVDELMANAHAGPNLVAFIVEESTRQDELPGSVPESLLATEVLPPTASPSPQVQELVTEELASTSLLAGSPFLLVDTNGSHAEAYTFHDASTLTVAGPTEDSVPVGDGEGKQDDLSSNDPALESSPSTIESSTPQQPGPEVSVQDEPEASLSTQVEAEKPVSDSPLTEPAPLPSDIEPQTQPPVVPDALSSNFVPDVNLKEDSVSIKSKSESIKATAVGKKALKSLKGVFGSSKSKTAGSGLTSPSTDSLASIESQGKASVGSAVETASSIASTAATSVTSNKAGSIVSGTKGGMKRLFGSKDKTNTTTSNTLVASDPPSLESVPSVETQNSPSDPGTLTPPSVVSGVGMKKKQRQGTIDSASPMLKGMFKGRNPLRKPTA